MYRDFWNRIYVGNIDANAIADAVQPELDEQSKAILDYFYDNFPNVATEAGILKWEIILGITASATTETLDFRRGRVINRLSSNTIYTERALREIMNNIMGAGNWSYELDWLNYRLTITSLRHGKDWVNEMTITLEKVLPSNLIFTLVIKYNTHQALADYTHEYLSQYTHTQLQEEDIS